MTGLGVRQENDLKKIYETQNVQRKMVYTHLTWFHNNPNVFKVVYHLEYVQASIEAAC